MIHKPTLLHASHRTLRQHIVDGHPVQAEALVGWAYRGTVLGMPRFIEKLSWQTFQKTFWRAPGSTRVVGWNVRLHQDGLEARSRPKTNRRGEPVTTWHYQLTSPAHVKMPRGFGGGLIIDYGLGNNPTFDVVHLIKDPLVALSPGNADVLMGVSALSIGGVCLETPSYFLLEREHPIDFVPAAARQPVSTPTQALLPFERRHAEALFDAILGASGVTDGPSLALRDTQHFWHLLHQHAPPYFAPGLRAAVHALTWLPLLMPGFRRPFVSLPRDARLRCVQRMSADPRFAVRQSLATLKILAAFAAFEDDAVRLRFPAELT